MKQNNISVGLIRLVHWLIDEVILLVVIIIFIFSIFSIRQDKQILSQAASNQYSQYSPERDGGASYEELKRLNPDLRGWITIYDTKIDYPVVQNSDEWDYLNRNVLREFSLSGSIYLEKNCSPTYQDAVNILYGHHMAHDGMFGGIDHYEERDYFDTHRKGVLYSDVEKHEIEIFAVFEANAYDWTIYESNPVDMKAYLKELAKRSRYFEGDYDELAQYRIVLLSTCSEAYNDDRHLLAAIIKE
ncbi:sortase B [Granulicatella balaenopterae]|uniref:Sortase B n=1 Tax=Granulicatella balaenopterae TaxID=137733 RepID=A0A1H9GWJ8_9LACT|nr:class B sortase [Granulicatella balaenopterae]SEQ54496.1 sortase B [Granulicatella balaenopterae]